MAKRYANTNTTQSKDTKKYYLESTIYPRVPPRDSDLYIITDETDRLDLLAFKYYGDTRMWWIIATANNINDANLYVSPGTQLRIPANTDSIMRSLENINK